MKNHESGIMNQGSKKGTRRPYSLFLIPHSRSGYSLIFLLVIGGLFAFILGGLAELAVAQRRLTEARASRALAFHIAEAGIDYYRWHLAHAPKDFTDGTNAAGPYVHPFADRIGTRIGSFTLTITPPTVGSTQVAVISRGVTDRFPNITRTVRTVFALPSLARYAFVSNAVLRFGSGTTVTGPVHGNDGIRFGGVARNLVTSAKDQYNDPDSDDCTKGPDFGVHTCNAPADPSPPNPVPNRPDIFNAGRKFPAPRIDFIGLTADLRVLKNLANTPNGLYLPGSNALGYQLTLNPDDTVSISRVVQVYGSPSKKCYDEYRQPGWGLWSIRSSGFIRRQPLPANGIIFVEDHAWVSGRIDTARVTIVSGRFESTPTNIILNQSLLYTNTDGRDVIGLIAQNNVMVGFKSNAYLRIDGALVAQNGFVGRYNYQSSCGTEYLRPSVTLFGMVATNQRYVFRWSYSGYDTRVISYDGNLLYNPPPHFPITTDAYALLTWEELR